jgi:hypothetical protein
MTEDWQRLETRGLRQARKLLHSRYNHIGKWGHGFGQKQTGVFKCRDDRVMDFPWRSGWDQEGSGDVRVLTGHDRRRVKRGREDREEEGKGGDLEGGRCEESVVLKEEVRNRANGTICAFPI